MAILQFFQVQILIIISNLVGIQEIEAGWWLNVLQWNVLQGKPSEENVWRCMKALLKFCTIGSREVPQLVKMIGPEPSKFAGMSARVDELLEPIMAKLASVPMF